MLAMLSRTSYNDGLSDFIYARSSWARVRSAYASVSTLCSSAGRNGVVPASIPARSPAA